MPRETQRLFLSVCDVVHLTQEQVLCESGEVIAYVYFPLECFISLVTRLDDGGRLEVGIVGREGMLGASLILGVKISSQYAVVQGAGTCLRMSSVRFTRCCRDNPALLQKFNRYVYVLMLQLALTAACTHYHVIERRLARWLLMTRDRARSDRFRLTHEFLSFMLGARRVGITEAANALHARALINYSRGRIDIIDGMGLEKASCGCYREANRMYEQMLGHRGNRLTRIRNNAFVEEEL